MKTRKTTRTIELTVESTEFSVRRLRAPVVVWCEGCGRQVHVVTPEAAARAADVSPREIYRRAEAAEVHFVETPEGALFICTESLS